MIEYLGGWKRVLGILLLSTALSLSAWWVRSAYAFDTIFLRFAGVSREFYSGAGMLGYVDDRSGSTGRWFEWHVDKVAVDRSMSWYIYEYHKLTSGGTWVWISLPYWVFVLPLTLLSLWLLFTQKRRPKYLAPESVKEST